MKALIIVDVQNDFLPGGALAVPDGDKVIPVINAIQKAYDLVVATQDWHPACHQSFASQHKGKQVFDTVNLHGLPQTLWPDHCIQGTQGAALSAGLDTQHVSAIFRKGMTATVDSYSAFFDNGHLQHTGLAAYLKSYAITEVHICGLAADYCVFFSAMDALEQGFSTAILLHATQPISPVGFERCQQAFMAKGGVLLPGMTPG